MGVGVQKNDRRKKRTRSISYDLAVEVQRKKGKTLLLEIVMEQSFQRIDEVGRKIKEINPKVIKI